nr:hypothetical protein [uncultured Albidiferax sp.]
MDKSLIQTGSMVETSSGQMFWPLEDESQASAFCEHGAKPVPIWVKVTELEDHQTAQSD